MCLENNNTRKDAVWDYYPSSISVPDESEFEYICSERIAVDSLDQLIMILRLSEVNIYSFIVVFSSHHLVLFRSYSESFF